MENQSYESELEDLSLTRIGEKLFTLRDYTPVPLIVLILFTAEPGAISATLGLTMIVCGELFRIYSVAFIGKVSRTRNSETVGAGLISQGPYGWMRNPLYVGNFAISVGMAMFAGVTWVVVLTVLLFGFQYAAIVKYEESLLVKKFGDAYHKYRDEVPAWFPHRIPSLEQWQWPDSFSEAIISEKRTLLAILVMVLALLMTA